MEYTRLGRAGAKVSRIALGTMNLGRIADEEQSHQILDAAVEAGITFLDSADVYGDPHGRTEEVVGRWLAARGNRDDLVVATKVFGRMGEGPNDTGLSSVHIRNAVDASLRRLQTDRIDLYQMHHIERGVEVDEILDAFGRLVEQGKILYLGSSNFAGWNLAQYSELAGSTGAPPLVTEQSLYHLAARTIELEVIPAAENYGIGILPWSPLGGGRLSGALRKTDRVRTDPESLGDLRPQIERYEAYADELGHDPAELALAWLLHQPAVTAPIIGPRTLDQLHSGIRALDIELSEEQLTALDEIFPGPGGQAPEAYAW